MARPKKNIIKTKPLKVKKEKVVKEKKIKVVKPAKKESKSGKLKMGC